MMEGCGGCDVGCRGRRVRATHGTISFCCCLENLAFFSLIAKEDQLTCDSKRRRVVVVVVVVVEKDTDTRRGNRESWQETILGRWER